MGGLPIRVLSVLGLHRMLRATIHAYTYVVANSVIARWMKLFFRINGLQTSDFSKVFPNLHSLTE